MNSRTPPSDGSLLLVIHLQMYRHAGKVYVEGQAANGFSMWLEHFSTVTACVLGADGPPPSGYIDVETLNFGDRLKIEIIEPAWTPIALAQRYFPTRRKLVQLIERHEFLHFGIGGAWGDWGSHSAFIAAERSRAFSVWTDRVEAEVMQIEARRHKGPRRVVRLINAAMAKFLNQRAIRLATLGLFHGKNTFDAFQHLNRNPQLVHDIHIKASDAISADKLSAKIAAAKTGSLKIIYAGRVHPDKGPMEWVKAIGIALSSGVKLEAKWYGDGPTRDEAIAFVDSLGIADCVEFPGSISDRNTLLTTLRGAHLMLFCHLTPESPRCLIEALAAGTPIVGYESAYARDLLAKNGGGVLTDLRPEALAAEIIALAADRGRLATLIGLAAKDGALLNDEKVFAHRSELMKAFT